MGEYADRAADAALYGDGSGRAWIIGGVCFRPGDRVRSASCGATGQVAQSNLAGPDYPPCIPINWDESPLIEHWCVANNIVKL